MIFILFCGFAGKDIKWISNIKCVSAVVTENIYLFSFVTLFLIMLRAVYLVYKYFFPYILVSLKKEFTVNAMEYLK